MPRTRKEALRPTVDKRFADYADAAAEERAALTHTQLKDSLASILAKIEQLQVKIDEQARCIQHINAQLTSHQAQLKALHRDPADKYSLTRAKLARLAKDLAKKKGYE